MGTSPRRKWSAQRRWDRARDAGRSLSVVYARIEFLRAVESEAPGVLQDLRDKVLPLYCCHRDAEAGLARPTPRRSSRAPHSKRAKERLRAALAARERLHDGLLKWARTWNLPDWCVRHAEEEMGSYVRVPERFRGRWTKPIVFKAQRRTPAPAPSDAPAFTWGNVWPLAPDEFPATEWTVTARVWNPTRQSRAEAEAAARAAFEDNMRARFDSVEAKARERGYLPALAKREDVHFKWVVRRRVLDEPYEDIVKACGHKVTSDAVRHAVKETADFIGVPPRPRTSARPRHRTR